MPAPTYALPEIGSLNSIADPQVRDALNQILLCLQGGIDSSNLSAGLLNRAAFVGEIRMSGTVTVPAGWLECKGQPVSRTTYAALYQALGIKFGAGDGSTTFNLPNMQDKYAKGAGAAEAIGAAVGVNSVTLTALQSGVRSHNHPDATHQHIGNTDYSNPQHLHDAYAGTEGLLHRWFPGQPAPGAGSLTVQAGPTNTLVPGPTGVAIDGGQTGLNHIHSFTTAPATAGIQPAAAVAAQDAHENRPASIAVGYIVYAGV